MSVVGIDFSTKFIDLVKRGDGSPVGTWTRCSLEHVPTGIAERDAILAREVPAVLMRELAADGDDFSGGWLDWWDGVWLVGIEYTFVRDFGSGMKTILGALMATVPDTAHVIPLPSLIWQGWFLRRDPAGPLPKLPRKGVERKPLIRERALELTELPDDLPFDAYDAFGISWAVEDYNRPATR